MSAPDVKSFYEAIGRMPPGTAIIARHTPLRGGEKVVWVLREESGKLRRMAAAGGTPLHRAKLIIEDGVAVLPLLICLPPEKPGNIWVTWMNVCEPTIPPVLDLLARQPRHEIALIGDQGTLDACISEPNILADWARTTIAMTKGLPAWSAEQFEQLKERICRRYPDVISLWRALGEAGGAVPAGTVPSFAAEWAQDPARPPPAQPDGDPSAERLSPVEAAYRGLYQETQEALRPLVVFKEAVSLSLLATYAAHLMRHPAFPREFAQRWETGIELARQRGLLRPHPQDPAYLAIDAEFTKLLFAHLQDYETPARCDAMTRAMYVTYGDFAETIFAQLGSLNSEQRETAAAAVRLEYENLLTALEGALRGCAPPGCLYLAMNAYLFAAGHHKRGVELGERFLRGLDCYRPVGEAIDGVRSQRARALCGVADHRRALGQAPAADANLQRALAPYPGGGLQPGHPDHRTLGETCLRSGMAALERHSWKEAARHFEKARATFAAGNCRSWEAVAIASLGRAAAGARDWRRAERHFADAAARYAALDERLPRAGLLGEWANMALARGRPQAARRRLRQALPILAEFGDHAREAAAYHGLARIAKDARQPQRAARYYRKAARYYSAAGDRGGRALLYCEVAHFAVAAGQPETAWAALRRALRLYRTLGDRQGQLRARQLMADLAERSGKWRLARRCFDAALALCRALADGVATAVVHLRLARLAGRQQQWADGRQHLDAGLRVALGSRNEPARELALHTAALFWSETGDKSLPAVVAKVLRISPREAKKRLRQAVEK